jgi:hypothetical protein
MRCLAASQEQKLKSLMTPWRLSDDGLHSEPGHFRSRCVSRLPRRRERKNKWLFINPEKISFQFCPDFRERKTNFSESRRQSSSNIHSILNSESRLDLDKKKRFLWRAKINTRAARQFQSKSRNWGKFWKALQWKMLAYFMDIWAFLWKFDIFHGHLVYFSSFWYTVPPKIWQHCSPPLEKKRNRSEFWFYLDIYEYE